MFPGASGTRFSTRDPHVVENALHQVLFNENIWSHAFAKERPPARKRTGMRWRLLNAAQFIYEKSRVQYLVPVMVLIAYSLLGGFIFYSIESPPEQILIQQKSRFINRERDAMHSVVLEVQKRVFSLNSLYSNDSYHLNLHLRAYRKFALNQLHKIVYWYALSAYYLTEQETNKVQTLRPRHAEPLWRPLMHSHFGRIHALHNYTNQLALRCWEIGVENAGGNWTKEQVDLAIEQFDEHTGLNHVLTPVWTIWNALLLAVTTYTTIGYGNVTAKTRLGQMAAMLYAVIGIPLVLMILHKLGRLCLSVLAKVWQHLCRLGNSIFSPSSSEPFRPSPEEQPEQDSEEIPLLVAIGVAFGWMFLCAGIYLRFEEDWDYFKSFYFFFCSLTTIGYGDVTPTNSEDMLYISVLVMVGLSLVSMCINVIQLKLEKLFEELLLSLMEEYSADPSSRPISGDKIGMLEMWRVWKKRKNRLRDQAKASKAVAGEQIARVIPFARRRERRQLLQQIQQRLTQLNKATQTDRIQTSTFGCDPVFAPPTSLFLSPMQSGLSKLPLHRLLVPQRAAPELLSTFSSSSSSSAPSPPSSPSSTNPPSFSSLSTDPSVKSEPTVPSAVRFPMDFDPSRRWTFLETGKLPRGAPRGLAVPQVYLSKTFKEEKKPINRRKTTHNPLQSNSKMDTNKFMSTPSPYTSSGASLV